ncbi:FAD-dependent oxidoreductase [uncultured Desulfuromonas sp.]|uniref:NAD(P)/FAD-dependent oxidoreductase n=1 Tax=uncultured Desulfuromonas sp. TaxID=181013 RepID=UPI00262BDC19|nr:FAD-dependent oxidoreductase [uncultured Desulfuromonas sp.]
MAKVLLLVGGGHAHLSVLAGLKKVVRGGHRAILVSPGDYHYYSGMGPGVLAGTYRPAQARFHLRRMVQERGGVFLKGEAVGIDPERRTVRLASGEELGYDVVSFNVGSEVVADRLEAAGEAVVPVKPITNLPAARRRILEGLAQGPLRLVVVGGGPAGLEVAGNLWRLGQAGRGRLGITLASAHGLLYGFPPRAGTLARNSLAARGIRVLEGERVLKVAGGQALLSGGSTVPCDIAILAAGIRPPSLFGTSGLPVGPDGGLLVNDYLQSVAFPEIFGGGDCIHFQPRPLARVGVYAVRQNPILFHNLRAALGGGALRPFRPQKDYMLIFNLGDGRGILRRKGWVWDGHPACLFKDWIDRRFMKKFQLSGEAREAGDDI